MGPVLFQHNQFGFQRVVLIIQGLLQSKTYLAGGEKIAASKSEYIWPAALVHIQESSIPENWEESQAFGTVGTTE